MKIAQLLLAGAPEYERKSQRVDFAALAAMHEVILLHDPAAVVRGSGARVAHVYGPPELPRAPFVGFPIPYIASGDLPRRRFALRRPAEPEYVVTPLRDGPGELLPEAVEEEYFDLKAAAEPPHSKVVGSFRRSGLDNIVQQTIARIARFRDDMIWHVHERPPTPSDLAGVDVWVDPALREDDFDGFVAEAMVAGRVVVASRTAINVQRTEKGRTGFLVPQNDPNELTHAILAAIFKPEVAHSKMEAARQTLSKFRPRQRLRVLAHMYETLSGDERSAKPIATL